MTTTYLLIKPQYRVLRVLALLLFGFHCLPNTLLAQTFSNFSPTSGNTGTQVTLQDQLFVNVTGVAFNGVPAAFFVPNAGSILTQVPSGATTGLIAVTTQAGTYTSTTPFLISLPLPLIAGFSPATGSSGTSVSINGQNFSNVIAVSFNGLASSNFVVNGSTNISAVVPSSATTGRIVVTTNLGSDTSATSFVVIPLTLPIITSFSPTSGVAGLTTVSIMGRNFLTPDPINAVLFNGVGVTTGTIISNTELSVDVPSGATTGRISISSGLGTTLSATNFVVTGQRNDICYTGTARQDTIVTPTLTEARYRIRQGQVAFVKVLAQGGRTYKFSTCNNASISTDINVYDRFGALLNNNNGFGVLCSASPMASLSILAPTTDTLLVLIASQGCIPLVRNIQFSYQLAGQPNATRLDPSSGPEGTVTTVFGQNLTSVTNVIFNQNFVNTISQTDTSITFEIPTPAITDFVSFFNGASVSRTNLRFSVCSAAAPIITPVGRSYLCQGRVITLEGPAGATTYNWSTGQTTQTITLNQAITVTLQVQQGTCLSAVSNPYVIRTRPTPTATITQRNDTLFAGPSNSSSFRWLLNGLLQSTSTSFIKVNTNANYQVIVNQNGCVDTSSIFSVNQVGGNLQTSVLKLYPNPASKILHITRSDQANQSILIYNAIGSMVMQIPVLSSQTEIDLDLSPIPNGVYYLSLGNDRRRFVKVAE